MKKLFITLFLLLFTINAHAVISPDNYYISSDVTLTKLSRNQSIMVNEINSLPGGNIQTGTITPAKLDANANPVNFRNEAFNDFVYTGLLPGTGTIAAAVITAGTAYVEGVRVVKAEVTPGATNYTASRDIYVDLSSTGVYTYSAVANGATSPAVAANSIRIAKVITSATNVTSVVDLRVLGISLSVEDFYINGLELVMVSPDASLISVDAGVCYVGATRIAKTSRTTLKFSASGAWYNGSTHSANKWCYVGIDNQANPRLLGNNPPDKADTSGNTTGILRYWYDTSQTKYWRVIGRVSQDSSGNVAWGFHQIGDTFWYDNPAKMMQYLPGSATFTKASLGTKCSSIDTEILFSANAGADGIGAFRSQYATYNADIAPTATNLLAAYTVRVGWFPVFLQGTSTNKSLDYRHQGGNAMTIYVEGAKIRR